MCIRDRSGDLRVIKPLITALRDTDSDVRFAAVNAFRLFDDPEAVEPLSEALEDSDSRVSRSAMGVLRQLGRHL